MANKALLVVSSIGAGLLGWALLRRPVAAATGRGAPIFPLRLRASFTSELRTAQASLDIPDLVIVGGLRSNMALLSADVELENISPEVVPVLLAVWVEAGRTEPFTMGTDMRFSTMAVSIPPGDTFRKRIDLLVLGYDTPGSYTMAVQALDELGAPYTPVVRSATLAIVLIGA